MRKREFLSPSSIALFFDNREAFYLKYLADTRLPEEIQTKPMSIGSAFDAHVKSALHHDIFGKGHDPAFELQTLFEAQVVEQNRDWAKVHGEYVFNVYKQSGAYQDILAELLKAATSPRFEFEVKGFVDGHRQGIQGKVGSVPLLGKPDVYYINKDKVPIILDWKVNGYCSNSAKSPNVGYIRLRLADRTLKDKHKEVVLGVKNGILVSKSHPMEIIDLKWANQLCIYGWLLGEPIGSEFITIIHQIVAKPTDESLLGIGKPILRIAEHVSTVSPNHQKKVYEDAALVWHCLETGHIFFEESWDDNLGKCDLLERKAKYLMENQSDPLYKLITSSTGW